MSDNYIRFDWAMKRLLRDKSNSVVLEGLLSTLLERNIRIIRFLESESNQEDAIDKFNRVDMLTENDQGEFMIIEVQNNRELDYFHRMFYGVSKAITDYINLGDAYSKIRKVYSINIVYFALGQGKDYVYHGQTVFHGLHDAADVLRLSVRQQELFVGKDAGDLFPEYYILRVNDFDKVALTPLDEWISFLKTGKIGKGDTARGLPEARERLRVDSLSEEEKNAYLRDMEALRYQQSVISTGWIEGRAEGKVEGLAEGLAEGLEKGLEKGRNEEKREIARSMKSLGLALELIVKSTGLTPEEIETL